MMLAQTQWTEVTFRIGTNEPAQQTTNANVQGDWSIKSLELCDWFGNTVLERSPMGRIIPLGKQIMSRHDDGIGLVRGAVWPGHPWNVRAEFQRNFTRLFDPAHCWTTSIPLPASGETNSLQQTGRVEGCAIEVQSIGSDGKSPPIVTVRLKGRDSNYSLGIIDVQDQRGSNVVWWFRGSAKGQFKWELRTEKEAKEAKVTFGVAHPVVVQLSGAVAILRTNVSYREGRNAK